MKKLQTVLSIVAAAASLTLGLTVAEAKPATVAISKLQLVGEKTTSKPSADIRVIGILGGGGGHRGGGYYGGHRGGGYYGGHHGGGYYGGHHGGGYYGGHRGGGYYGRRMVSPVSSPVSPQVKL